MKVKGLRWLMVSLIFLVTVINYIDRQTVSVLKTSISQDLGLSNADYAAIQNSFLLFYGISQMVSGRLYDVIGTRLGFVFSIVVWSSAAAAHAIARTALSFSVFRAVLGFGEAGNWPGAAKVVGEWFPVRERAFGMGIFNTGAAVGGALSPPIIAWLATAYGWRATFIVTGALGFIWLALWLVLFRAPDLHPWITAAERAHILEGASGTPSGPAGRRGWTVNRARKAVMIFGALLTSAGILAMRASDPYVALGWMAVVLFGFQVWGNNLQTLPSDFFPNTAVGSVFGLGGAAAALGSILFTWGTGQVVDAFGYTPVFFVAGILGPLGLVVTLWLAGRIDTVAIERKAETA